MSAAVQSWIVAANSPEEAVEIVKRGQGVPVQVGAGMGWHEYAAHAGQSAGWSTTDLLLWGALGFAVGGLIGSVVGWHACVAMGVGKAVGENLPHLLPLIAGGAALG